MAKIKFLGAAQTVTGSATLIEFKKTKILIDCGMFQGPKEIRNHNWTLYDKGFATSIDCIILTHAHVDHSAMIPKLYQLGFRGPVYCTDSTNELSRILLPDSAYLQEEDARRKKNGNGEKKNPLYSVDEANQSLKLFQVVSRHQWFELSEGLSFRFFRAGHILGSSIIQLSLSHGNGVRVLTFTGDLGNGRQKMIKGPEDIFETDDLIIESTYGDRVQEKFFPEEELKTHISHISLSGGALVIPAFAVGRTQEILYMIKRLEEDGQIPSLPVYLDSPMALEATSLYLQDRDDIQLELEDGQLIKPLSPSNFIKIKKMEDSIRLVKKSGPLIIISAAGMLTGGRILYHLKERLSDPNSVVLFVGYQAEGTKGRLLQAGLKNIHIHKEDIRIKAKIATIESLSAHADSDDLVAWVQRFNRKPKRVFINHGEKEASRALAYRLKHELGLDVYIPKQGEVYTLFE